jgi:hypothetical protein
MAITLELSDEIEITEEIISAYFIVRADDTAFIRTNYP